MKKIVRWPFFDYFICALLSSLTVLLLFLCSGYSVFFILIICILIIIVKINSGIFYLFLLLLPIDRIYFPLSFKIKFYQIVLIFAIVIYALRLLNNKNNNNFRLNYLDYSLVGIYIVRIFSLFISIDYIESFHALLLHAIFLAVYFYVRSECENVGAITAINYMVICSIFPIIYGVFEIILSYFGTNLLQTAYSIHIYGGRPSSFFLEPDWFGGYLALIVAITFPFVLLKDISNLMVVKFNIIFFFSFLMILVLSVRSSWLGLLSGCIISFLIIPKYRKKIAIIFIKLTPILIIAIFGFLVIAPNYYKSISYRFDTFISFRQNQNVDSSTDIRFNSYKILINYILNRPFKGYGVGAWKVLSKEHLKVNSSTTTNNILLTMIFEAGVFGGIVFIIWLTCLFKVISDSVKYSRTEIEYRYSLGVSFAIICSLVVAIFNDISQTGWYWAFLALFNNYSIELKKKYCLN